MLCNVALNGLEGKIRERFPVNKNIKGGKPKCYVLRYADDIVVTGANQEILQEAKAIITEFLQPRGLVLKEAKTRIVTVEDGFDFLGYNFRRKPYNPRLNQQTDQDTVLIIKPADKAVRSLLAKVKTELRRDTGMITVIKELNPVIRGWSNYFRYSYHSQATFIKMGNAIWSSMMA
jgi:RNA-directed DNA polymerase